MSNMRNSDPVERFETRWKDLADPEKIPVSDDFMTRLEDQLPRRRRRFFLLPAPAFVGLAAAAVILMVFLTKVPGDPSPVNQLTTAISSGITTPSLPAETAAPRMVTFWLDRETPLHLALKTNSNVKGEQI